MSGIFEGPAADLAATIAKLGPVSAGVAFRYPGGADLDLIAGTAVVEVKTTTSRRGLADVLQPLGYALLAEPGTIETLVWAFPRAGKTFEVAVSHLVARIADQTDVTVEALRAELLEVVGFGR